MLNLIAYDSGYKKPKLCQLFCIACTKTGYNSFISCWAFMEKYGSVAETCRRKIINGLTPSGSSRTLTG